jgi:hypothetical protein
VAEELVVKGKKALQVAVLGIKYSLGLAGDFSRKVEGRQVMRRILAASMVAGTFWNGLFGSLRAVFGIHSFRQKV